MKILVRSLFIAAAFVGVASADTAPKKAPPAEKAPAKPAETKKAELSPQEAEKFLAFFNKFVDTVVAAKEDCTRLTKDINGLIDANAEMLEKIRQAKAANKDLPQATKEKMMARVKELMPAMSKCQSDAGFMAAMKRMEGGKSAPAKAEEKKGDSKAPAKAAPAKSK